MSCFQSLETDRPFLSNHWKALLNGDKRETMTNDETPKHERMTNDERPKHERMTKHEM